MDKQTAIEDFGAMIASLPQITIPTEHHFANGMYARVMAQEAGSILVGKKHKHEHFFLVLSGAIRFTGGEEAETYHAPSLVVSKPGAQRAIFALEDSSYMTIHRTELTDLDEIEEDIIEPCPIAMFDSSNIAIVRKVE